MIKLKIFENVYLQRDETISIFDKNLNLVNKLKIDNADVYENIIININQKEAKIYKLDKLYHTIELPKDVNRFILYKDFIVNIEKTALTIISIIGNKIVFNGNIAKEDIIDYMIVDDLLVFYSKNMLYVLDLIKKSFILKKECNVEKFHFDGKNIVYTQGNDIFVLDIFTKNTKTLKFDKQIDKIEIYQNYIAILSDNQLFITADNLFNKSIECYEFHIKDGILYSVETGVNKYKLSKLIKKTNSKIKCLTVDDSMTMRLIIKNAIKNHFDDIEVFEAKNGKEALEVLEEYPDMNIAFMDWNMPVMNGKEAVIKIRENPKYDKLKIIMATTEGGKDKVREMIKYGVKGYLVKPLKPTSVIPVVEKMIELIKEEDV